MTRRSTARRTVTRGGLTRSAALLFAGLSLTGVLAACANDSQSGDSQPDRESETVPVPGEPSESPS